MTEEQIRAAVLASPTLEALARLTTTLLVRPNDAAGYVDNDAEPIEHVVPQPDAAAIAAALTLAAPPRVVQPKMVSARGLAERYADGPIACEVVLLKLQAAATAMLASQDVQTKATGSLLNRQLQFLAADGLDFGSAALRAMLDLFATPQGGGVLSSAEAAKLKAVAEAPGEVTDMQVRVALLNADGTLRI